MSDRLWLVPLQPTAALLRVTVGVLERHAINYVVIGPEEVRARLEGGVPAAALIHGGVITALLLDVQRWLTEPAVPTMVLVEGLTDDSEAFLLDRGAYDVVSIPAPARKLGSRIEAVARTLGGGPRLSRLHSKIVVSGDLKIVPSRRSVTVGVRPVLLSKSEFDLLLALARRPGEVLTRQQLAMVLDRDQLTSRALESHISRIRTKVRRAGGGDRVRSVRGVGYRLVE